MKFARSTLATCGQATGTVVAIDVLRAFSTAAYAFGAGVNEIFLVGEVAEAESLRAKFPGAHLTGEVGGKRIPGFDFGNSPVEVANADLSGTRLIQRTSAGTQGVVLSRAARHLLTSSFVCAHATAEYIRCLDCEEVTFVITGEREDWNSDEDAACADYLEALLKGERPAPEPYLERVRNSPTGRMFSDPTVLHLPPPDLEACTEVDRFDFAMPVSRENGLLVLRAVRPG
jgi:2-phosphosulfolactate phosphatase